MFSNVRTVGSGLSIMALSLTSSISGACRPSADQKYPTLAENFGRAKSVYFATIVKSSLVGKVSKLELQIEKIFKGVAPSENSVLTNESSSCDRLPYGLAKGDGCIFFELPNGKLMTSMFDGESSFCLPKGAPRLKTLVDEYEAKFRSAVDKPKP